MKGDQLFERFLNFAARIIKLVNAMPRFLAGRHVATQLLRSGTSAGANYEEARGGESRADFIHKLAVSWKETRESRYWLQLIHRAQLLKPILVAKLLQESDELSRILSKSLATARDKV